MGRTRIGCTGWAYPDWRGPFYPADAPPRQALARYAQVFDLTEIDSSYYSLPKPSLVQRWADETPPGFEFTAKLPSQLTHEQRLRAPRLLLDATLQAFQPLRDAKKLGPLLAQMGPRFQHPAHHEDLARFLDEFPHDLPLAIELRHASWWNPDTYRLLRSRGVALAWSVTRYGDTPPVPTAPFLYLRFVGDRSLTRFHAVQRDQTPTLQTWKRHLEEHGRDAERVYVVVNNHFMGYAPETARIAAQVLGLAPPDLGRAQRPPRQRRLADYGER